MAKSIEEVLAGEDFDLADAGTKPPAAEAPQLTQWDVNPALVGGRAALSGLGWLFKQLSRPADAAKAALWHSLQYGIEKAGVPQNEANLARSSRGVGGSVWNALTGDSDISWDDIQRQGRGVGDLGLSLGHSALGWDDLAGKELRSGLLHLRGDEPDTGVGRALEVGGSLGAEVVADPLNAVAPFAATKLAGAIKTAEQAADARKIASTLLPEIIEPVASSPGKSYPRVRDAAAWVAKKLEGLGPAANQEREAALALDELAKAGYQTPPAATATEALKLLGEAKPWGAGPAKMSGRIDEGLQRILGWKLGSAEGNLLPQSAGSWLAKKGEDLAAGAYASPGGVGQVTRGLDKAFNRTAEFYLPGVNTEADAQAFKLMDDERRYAEGYEMSKARDRVAQLDEGLGQLGLNTPAARAAATNLTELPRIPTVGPLPESTNPLLLAHKPYQATPELVAGSKAGAKLFGDELGRLEQAEKAALNVPGHTPIELAADTGLEYAPHIMTDKAKAAWQELGRKLSSNNPGSKVLSEFNASLKQRKDFELTPEIAVELGLPQNWRQMTIDEVNKLMKSGGADPSTARGHAIANAFRDIDFFETDPTIILNERARRTVRSVSTANFLETAKRFGKQLPAGAKPVDGWKPVDHPRLKDFVFPTPVANHLNKLARRSESSANEAASWLSRNTSWLRAQALLSPGYHLRNVVGNVWNSVLAGMRASEVPRQYAKALAFMLDEPIEVIGKSGARYSRDEIYDAAQKSGIFRGGQTAVETGGDLAEQPGLMGRLFEANADAGSFVENQGKMALLFSRLEHGDDLLSATRAVKEALFDYGDLTSIEEDFIKPAMFFYTFMRKNLPYQIEKLTKNPAIYARVKHVRDYAPLLEQAVTGGQDADERFMQPFIKEGGPVRLPWRNKKGQTEYFLLDSWLPVSEASKVMRMAQYATNGFKNIAKGFMGDSKAWDKALDSGVEAGAEGTTQLILANLGPIFKELYAQTLNEDPFFHDKVEKGSVEFLGMRMSSRVAHALRIIRMANDLDRINPSIATAGTAAAGAWAGANKGGVLGGVLGGLGGAALGYAANEAGLNTRPIFGSRADEDNPEREGLPSMAFGAMPEFLQKYTGMSQYPVARQSHVDPDEASRLLRLGGVRAYPYDQARSYGQYMTKLKKAIAGKTSEARIARARGDQQSFDERLSELLDLQAEISNPTGKLVDYFANEGK